MKAVLKRKEQSIVERICETTAFRVKGGVMDGNTGDGECDSVNTHEEIESERWLGSGFISLNNL